MWRELKLYLKEGIKIKHLSKGKKGNRSLSK